MPWEVRKSGSRFCVVKLADGSTVACHDTRDEADAQVRALYAAEPSAGLLDARELSLFVTAAREVDVNLPGAGGHDLLLYWTRGRGAAEILWGTDGSMDRCIVRLDKYVKNPGGLCAEYHKAATGEWPRGGLVPSAGEVYELREGLVELVDGIVELAGQTHSFASSSESEREASTQLAASDTDLAEANLDTPDAADLNAAARRVAAERGWALPDGSYPIRDEEHHGLADLRKAIRAVGRGGRPHDEIRRHIMKRARALDAADRIPENWTATGMREEAALGTVEELHGNHNQKDHSNWDDNLVTAAGGKKCSSGQHRMPDGTCMNDSEMNSGEVPPLEYADEPWEGVLVVEGAESGDGRLFALGSLDWAQLPLPLQFQPANNGGHAGSVTVGEITNAARRGEQVYGWGTIFATALGGEHGDGIRNAMRVGGVSVDVDKVKDADVELIYAGDEGGGGGSPFAKPETTIFHRGRIRGATLVAFPAFIEAKLHFTGALAEAKTQSCGCGDDAELAEDDETALVVASAADSSTHTITIPNVPPASWFSEPTDVEVSGALTITDEGRVFGLVAPANVTHRNVKTKVPRNVDFSRFHKAETIVRGGGRVVTGVITADCGHAPTQNYGTLERRREHYDNSCSVLANARVGYSRDGNMWVAGALNPGASAEQVAQALGCTLSLDVQPHPDRPGVREFIAAHLVPVPGFPMARSKPSATYSDGVLSAAALPVEHVSRPRAAYVSSEVALEFVNRAKAAAARDLGLDPVSRKRVLAKQLSL